MIDHLGIQCQDLPAAAAFYDTVLAPLGGARILDYGVAIGFGFPGHPNFWVGELADGAEVLHEPRVWPEYHDNYYGAFVRDPDGNSVEACCHLPEPV